MMDFRNYKRPEKHLFNHLDTGYFLWVQEFLKEELNITNQKDSRKFLMTFSELYSTYSISKAEDSTLTLSEAEEISYNLSSESEPAFPESVRKESEKLSTASKTYQKDLKKLYNKLEFWNILRGYRLAKTDRFLRRLTSGEDVSIPLKELHSMLTYGLDEIFAGKLESYHKYFPGVFRNSDDVVIGNKTPLRASMIPDFLSELSSLLKDANDLESVFRIHWKTYRAHLFRNGNKRLTRTIENALLFRLWFDVLNPNIGYHFHKPSYIKIIVDNVVGDNEIWRMDDLWKSSMLLSAGYMMSRDISSIRRKEIKGRYPDSSVFIRLTEGTRANSTRLKKEVMSKNKISEASFFLYLKKEKEKLWDLVNEETVGKNVFYSLNIRNERYLKLIPGMETVVSEYSKFNPSYMDIPFLRYY